MDLQDVIVRLKILHQDAVGARFDELVKELITLIEVVAAELEEEDSGLEPPDWQALKQKCVGAPV